MFEIISPITDIETFATSNAIREIDRLKKCYGTGHWRKRKGFADIRLPDGTVLAAEIHWYEANGIGRKEFKIKQILE